MPKRNYKTQTLKLANPLWRRLMQLKTDGKIKTLTSFMLSCIERGTTELEKGKEEER